MGANRRAVDPVMPALDHRLGESDGHTLPHSAGAPAPETPVDRVPFSVLFRHIAPRRTGAKPPQDAVDDVATVRGRAPAASLSRLPFNPQQHPQKNATRPLSDRRGSRLPPSNLQP